MTIPTAAGDYPVHARLPRPLSAAAAQDAVAEHVAVVLRELAGLDSADLGRLGDTLRYVRGELAGPGAAYIALTTVAALLVHVVDAHPDAAARLAAQLDAKGA